MKRASSATRFAFAASGAIGLLVIGLRVAVPAHDADVWSGVRIGPAVVAAASPAPSAPGGDTRSPGEGPGLVGAPFLAIAGVVLLGLAAAGATVVYLRLTTRQGPPGDGPPRGPGTPRE